MQIADRMARLGTETAFEVLAEVERLKATGKEIISFAVGEPDFDTPRWIRNAGIDALERGETHYNPSAGIRPLREAIARYIERTRGVDVDPDEVVVTPGAKPVIFGAILACVNPGDEVIYPNPGFPIYESVIAFVGARPVSLPPVEERRFRFDAQLLRSLITPRTRMIILNSPHNPTGAMLTQEDLKTIAELANQHDLWVASDEIYSRIIYDGAFHSIVSVPGMKERTVLIDGVSKTYAMTGWRLGFGVMNRELAAGLARIATNVYSCVATFTQHAAFAALEKEEPQREPEAMVAEFKVRRELIWEGLNDIPGIRCLKPAGAFYAFPNVTELCRTLKLSDSGELQRFLLHEAGVAVLGRNCFGHRDASETGEYIRLSYATSQEQITAGLERMRKAIEAGVPSTSPASTEIQSRDDS
ncbi:MAG: pyridoxal phosphate-dependent aminotransferase [Candidatus Bipolaricaulia bacterium]